MKPQPRKNENLRDLMNNMGSDSEASLEVVFRRKKHDLLLKLKEHYLILTHSSTLLQGRRVTHDLTDLATVPKAFVCFL